MKHRFLEFMCEAYGFSEPELDEYEIEEFGDLLTSAHALWAWGRRVLGYVEP